LLLTLDALAMGFAPTPVIVSRYCVRHNPPAFSDPRTWGC